jgi:hypothetical protein
MTIIRDIPVTLHPFFNFSVVDDPKFEKSGIADNAG